MASQNKFTSIAKALEARDLASIRELLLSSNAKDKRAILEQLMEDETGEGMAVFLKPGDQPIERTECQQNHMFRTALAEMITDLGAKDAVIKNFMDSKIQFSSEKLGSGPYGKPLDHYFCANVDLEKKEFCINKGNRHCGVCGLVGYCSIECQRKHWPKHKTSCKRSQFRDAVWKPHWDTENRQPAFVAGTGAPDPTYFGYGVHLWGNTPAFDLINFPSNEHKKGRVWQEEMRVLFAASGDFRSMVETLASVPENYCLPMEIVINDRETVIVARNLIMASLLLLKGEEAIDTVINLWYSAAMGHEQFIGLVWPVVNDHLIPLMQNQDGEIRFSQSSIELNQMQAAIRLILKMMANKLDIQEAINFRNAVMVNPARRDYTDRHLLVLKEFHRESFDRFRTHGLLLPHEALNAPMNFGNKFIFHPDKGWVLADSDDPKEGWDMIKVMEFGDQMKLPRNDLYGRLFFYIRDRVTKMVATLRRIPVKIRFFQTDARDLAKKFKEDKLSFDRVDVSNISDENYVGISAVLNDWAPLLNKSNPNSAIVTLFLNWCGPDCYSVDPDRVDPDILKKMAQFLGLTRGNWFDQMLGGMVYAMPVATSAFTDQSKKFQDYLRLVLKNKPENVKRRMKHRIVPHRVMLPLDASVDATVDCLDKHKQYFAVNWSTNLVNRYVEWGFD